MLPAISSEITGTLGSSRASAVRIAASDASSAAVTGELSGLSRRSTLSDEIARMTAEALATIAVRSSNN